MGGASGDSSPRPAGAAGTDAATGGPLQPAGPERTPPQVRLHMGGWGWGQKSLSMSQVGSVNSHIVFTSSHQESRNEDKTSQIVNVRWRWDHS